MATTTNKAVVGAAAVAVTGAVLAAAGAFSPRIRHSADVSDAEIARFLTQCTFGVTDADIAAVRAAGDANPNLDIFDAWLTQQMAMAPYSMLAGVRTRLTKSKPYSTEPHGAFLEQYWTRAITGPDQLRQRVQFALSQIFTVSRENDTLMFLGSTATTAYYDLLGACAFGNWRTLIEKVTLNPIVGIFLNHITNDKEDPATGRHPDENFAREVMQLFSIGTVVLNPDGTPVMAGGQTVPSYTHDDIAGLAKVVTGFSWFSPTPDYTPTIGPEGLRRGTYDSSAYGFFQGGGENGAPSQMIPYPHYHSTSEKSFLGVTIPAAPLGDRDIAKVNSDLKIALDTLFNHRNTAPYFAKRMIQQFVTSNPTPAYVGRVAAVFADNGSGVRGDLGAVIKAILLDSEARDTAAAQASPIYGKVREPVIRVTNWGRSFQAKSKRGFYSIDETGTADTLDEAVLDAPSVFNFWRATYVPPRTLMGAQPNPFNPNVPGLTVPEFQVVSELTVASYINLIEDTVARGIGTDQVTFSGVDVSSTYVGEVAIADNADALLDRMNLLLFYGQMSPGLRQQILTAVNAVAIPTGSTATAAKIAAAKLNRAKLAVTLCMVSGEYLVQR